MINIVANSASWWKYSLNAEKSVVISVDLGESSKARARARAAKRWLLGTEHIKEVDEQHHIGILHVLYMPPTYTA